jgi:ATP-dependent Clp protease ATP-binding subunit ClpA
MFERFTKDARQAVVLAQEEAVALHHGWIGTEHLLLAVLADEGSGVTAALHGLGLDSGRVREQVLAAVGAGVDDDTALRDLGIDLDAVRRRVEERFGVGALDVPRGNQKRGRVSRLLRFGRRRPPGPCGAPSGHIPFTPRAKKSLELALREAVAAKSREIRAEHLVLGMMREDGLAARAVSNLGVPPETVRRTVLTLGRAA